MDEIKEALHEEIDRMEIPENLEVDSIRVTVVFKRKKLKQGTDEK